MSKRLGIIGCGQLGQMLAQAGKNLGVEVCFLKRNNETPVVQGLGEVFEESNLDSFLAQVDYVTIEVEEIPEHILKAVSDKVPLAPSFDALIRLRSRQSQKAIFDELDLPTAAWCYVEHPNDFGQALAQFPNEQIRAKRVLGGYDGGGQWRFSKSSPGIPMPDDAFPLIMEAEIEVDFEISVLMARAKNGDTECYPLNHNEMRDGVLAWSFIPAQIPEAMGEQARHYAKTLMDALDYVGILAMELFVCNGQLVVNEIAPRVHNTGHWTIEGCQCSQFEQHIRAVMEMPLRAPNAVDSAGLCNLLGGVMPITMPDEPVRMHLHGYGKSFRPGRKMGHLTLIGPDLASIRQAAQKVGVD